MIFFGVQQAVSGVQLHPGARQSMLSTNIESCAGVNETELSLACGQINLPR
jgi:hypothetical protein